MILLIILQIEEHERTTPVQKEDQEAREKETC
jgi:hypothetical protein